MRKLPGLNKMRKGSTVDWSGSGDRHAPPVDSAHSEYAIIQEEMREAKWQGLRVRIRRCLAHHRPRSGLSLRWECKKLELDVRTACFVAIVDDSLERKLLKKVSVSFVKLLMQKRDKAETKLAFRDHPQRDWKHWEKTVSSTESTADLTNGFT